MQGKNEIIKSSQVIESKTLSTPPPCLFYFGEEVYLVVGFSKVVLNVVVLGWDSQLDKLLLESAGLFKETMYFSAYLHDFEY